MYQHRGYTTLVLGVKVLSDIFKGYCVHKMTGLTGQWLNVRSVVEISGKEEKVG